MQQWFNLSDPAMEVALHDMALFRDFAGLGGWYERVLEKRKPAPKGCRRATTCCAARA